MGNENGDDPVLGRHVVGGHAEIGPSVAPDEVGGIILELADDRPEGRLVGRVLEVAHDVGVDAELLDDLHRLP